MSDELTNYLDFSPFYAGFEFEDAGSRRTFFDEYVRLPMTLKDFLVSPEVATQIFNLGKIKGLNEAQTLMISAILKYVLSGHVYLKDVPTLLVHYIKVDDVKAQDIFASLVKQVLAPVWSDVKKIQVLNFGIGKSQELDQLQPATPSVPTTPPSSKPPTGVQPPFAAIPRPSTLQQSPASAAPRPSMPSTPSTPSKYPGSDLPETGGNIVDLRKQKL